MVDHSGTDVEFHWDDVPGTDDYVLFSSLDPSPAFTTQEGSASSGVAGITIPATPDPPLVYYLIAGRNQNFCVGPQN